MNYSNIYNQLIIRAKTRTSPTTYTERHHIVPRCMGGSDDNENLVRLFPEEHYIAHLLLVKIHPTNRKLIYAANMMANRTNNNKIYGWVKRKFSVVDSISKTGISRSNESVEKQKQTVKAKIALGEWVPPNLGKFHTYETKKKISDMHKGKSIPIKSRSSLEGYIIRYGDIDGPIKYQEDSKTKDSRSLNTFIQKFGEIEGYIKYQENCTRIASITPKGEDHPMFGKTHTNTTKALIAANTSKHQKGRLKSEEHKARIGAAHKGRKHTIVECPHCPKSGGLPSMKKWHFDNCKFKSV